MHAKFVQRLQAAQAEIARRNKSPERLLKGQGLPYTLMMPSKPPLQQWPDDRPPARYSVIMYLALSLSTFLLRLTAFCQSLCLV